MSLRLLSTFSLFSVELGFRFGYDVLKLFLHIGTDLPRVAPNQDSVLDGSAHYGTQKRSRESEYDSGSGPDQICARASRPIGAVPGRDLLLFELHSNTIRDLRYLLFAQIL